MQSFAKTDKELTIYLMKFRLNVVISVLSTAIVTTILQQIVHAATVRQAQWFLDNVHVIAAQQISRGEGVVVCVLDSGVDATHPDLLGVVLPGKSFGESPSPDATSDTSGHGTSMAGLVAAQGGGVNNALGVAPGSKILPVAGPSDTHANLEEAIRYCVDHGAKVLNLSGGRPGSISKEDQDAIAYALQKDVVVVVAMGNRGQTSIRNGFAELPGVIAVTGTIQSNEAWPDSWTGPTAALSAPATNVSAIPKAKFSSGYSNDEGTSDSAAIVSGVAALIRSKYPNLDAPNVINRLIKSSTDLGAPGRDEIFGFGLVDAEKALTIDVAKVTKNPLGEASSSATNKTNAASNKSGAIDLAAGSNSKIIAGVIVWIVILGLVVTLVLWRRATRRRLLQQASPYDPRYMQLPELPQAQMPTIPQQQVSMPPGGVITPQTGPPAQTPTQYPPRPGQQI